MDRNLGSFDGAVMGLATAGDLFEKLKAEGDRLQGVWHSYDAFNFVVTAWHLYKDWLKQPPSDFAKSKRERADLPPEMGVVLDVLRDLGNGSKHLELSPRSAKLRKVDSVHSGRAANWHSWFFHEDMPGASVGTSYFSIRVLRNITLRYFAWVFDDSAPSGEFPAEIVDTIAYCNIATRSGPSPDLWLRGIDQRVAK